MLIDYATENSAISLHQHLVTDITCRRSIIAIITHNFHYENSAMLTNCFSQNLYKIISYKTILHGISAMDFQRHK